MVKTSTPAAKLYVALLFAILFLSANILKAQMVGANCYIKGTSVEIGIAGNGGYEGCPTGVSPPLPGMHFRSGNPYFGFVSNPQVNAWATFDGDFFTPGSPENGWGVEVGSATGIKASNNCAPVQQINGALTSWSQTFTCISADWQGDLTSSTNIHFKINYFLNQSDLFYTTTVSITNNTGATIPELYYYRNFDPDNNQSISGDFTTTNTIVSQPFTGACNTAHVKGTSTLPASQPMSYVGLAGTGANWRAYYGGFANRDASDLWNGIGFTQAVGSSTFSDIAIGLAYKITNLAPGATETIKFVVILDDLAAAQAVANTTYLTYPGSLTAPPAACTPYTDTAKICQGVPATIGVTGPNIASYNWSWSPGTGLSSTTGATVSASPATTTTYTVTGTPINACFAPISFPIVVSVKPSPTVNPEPNLTYCAGAAVPLNGFISTPAGATFTWTNSNTAIGLGASGSGSLPAFTATNSSGAPITSTITVTPTIAGNPCPGIPSTFTITVNPNPVTTVNSVGICPGQTATLTAAGATTYVWSTGATTNPISVSPAVNTTYTVTGTTGTCTSTAVASVTIGASVAISVNTPTICNGQIATLTATGASTYVWNTGATSNPLNVTPSTTTTYTVTGTATGGCTGTATGTVTVNPVPVTTSTSTSICAGGTATLTAGGATTYVWNTGSTANPLSVSPATTTTYTVTGTSLGCSSTAVGTVAVNPPPVTTVNSPIICPGGTATLTAGGATTYTWSTGATTNPITVSPASTTTYTVTGTTLGCTSTAVATVTIGASVAISVNTPTICAGSSATLTASGASTYVWNTGATTNPLTVSPATTTTYTVTGTAVGGCTGTATATVTVNPMPVTTSTNTTICAGQTASLTAGGATTYAWSTGATTNPLSVAPSTTTSYTVTGTSLGCSTTAVGTVTVNPMPVTAVNQPFICPTATATLTATGATTYVWSTGATTNPITVSPASTTSYTVTGTSLGCSSTAVAVVTVGGSIVATVNSPTICAGQTATLTATGGSTYTWNTGATTNPLNVTPATTTSYTVTANAGGCTGSAIATVTVNPLPVTTSTNTTICNGSVATLTAGGATSYTWDTGSTANPLSISPSTTTSYTVTGSSLGCTSTAVGTVTVNPIPVTTVNSPAICPATTANLTAGGAATYTWTAGATPTGVNTADASPAATTSYTVTGTSLGCSSTAVATVTVNAALIVNAGVNDSVCFGESAVLGVSPNGAGYSYSWTPAASLTGATTATPTATPATTTTYTVLLTDPSGCTGTSSVTIFANPMINLSAIVGLPASCFGACDGQSIVIPAGGSGLYPSYAWSGGCTTAACNQCAGTYTVTVTDSWGCTASNSATVVEPTLLTASSVNTVVSCNGVCDGTATATGAGGTTGYSFSWNTVPVQTTPTATGLCAGTYVCTITDANGCTATTSTTITEPTLVVTAPISNATICTGGTTTLTASASGGNGGLYTYNWTPAGTGSTGTVVVTPAATTNYTVSAFDVNGCPAAPVLVTVTVNPALLVVASGTASICPGASATISAAASQGNGGPYTYTWAPAGGSGSPVTVTPAATTTYTVTASDGCSPTATSTVTITVLPVPAASFIAPVTAGCDPLCVNFFNTSTVPGGIATWLFDYGDGSTPDTAHTHCYNGANSYDVTMTVSSNIGGCVSSISIPNYITVHPIPNAQFSAPLSSSILSPTVSYTDESTISSGSITGWAWNFGDPFASGADAVSTLQNPSHEFTEAGTYCATLTVTSNFGCISSIDHCVVIDPEFTFFIPNAFSPNGDGINDEFYGKGDFILDFEMMIFDRWGNMIFFADDINKHWDGTANHGKELAQQDVYVYVVKLTDHKDKKHKYQGTVTIVK